MTDKLSNDMSGDRPKETDGTPVERRKENNLTHAITGGAVAGATVGAEVAANIAENKMKLWREMTAFILLCIILYILINNFLTQFKILQENTERRDTQRSQELREMRKEYQDDAMRRIEAENKRSEMNIVELRTVANKFDIMNNRLDSMTNKIEMSVSEIRLTKTELEKTHKAIKDIIKK